MVVVKEIEERFEEYQENENFAPKEDRRDCPMTTIIYLPLYANGN